MIEELSKIIVALSVVILILVFCCVHLWLQYVALLAEQIK